MPRFTFQRRIRTAGSEQYNIYDASAEVSEEAIGQVDLHYLSPTHTELSIVLFMEPERDTLEELLVAIDDDLLFSTGQEDRRARAIVFVGHEHSFFEFDRMLETEDEDGPLEENQIV